MGGADEVPADPRVEAGPFGALMAQIRQCKAARTCPDLEFRHLYFEPNPATVAEWQATGLYSDDVDRRVVFVCESPSAFGSRNDPSPLRNWGDVGPSRLFRKAREEYGFERCYITDSVKCGARPRGKRHHSDAEIGACRGFLAQELDLLAPLVVVAVGVNAHDILQQDVLPLLSRPPVLSKITHYAAHCVVQVPWEREFGELHRLLSRLKPQEER